MRRLSIPGYFALAAAAAACSPPVEPDRPALAFRSDPAAYAWIVVEGATPVLALSPSAGPADAAPALALGCRGDRVDLRVGALTAEPVPVPIELAAGPAVLTVATRRVVTAERVELAGEGEPDAGWFEALAKAEVLRLRYGDQGLALRGPGPALTGRWRDLCRAAGAR